MKLSREEYEMASHALIGAAQQMEAWAAQLGGEAGRDLLAQASRYRALAARFAQAEVNETGLTPRPRSAHE
jgi:hypothetical protein